MYITRSVRKVEKS